MHDKKPTFQSWILLILLALIWGSSYILIKYSLKAFNPLQLGSLRVTIAFIVLSPLLLVGRYREYNGKQWVYVVLVGLLGSAFPAVLFATAQTRINSSLAAILNALVPLSTLVVGALFFREKFSRYKIAGVLLGILGSGVTILMRSNGLFDGNNFFALLVILAGICYALETNILKQFLGNVSPMGLTAWSFACIGPFTAALAWQCGAFTLIAQHPESWKSLGYLTILSVMGTALAIILFNMLVQQTTALFASTVTYLIPIVAVLWGINDGEAVSFIDLLGLGGILLGIYLTGK